MLFSLGQVLGLPCNPAESTQKALSLPCRASCGRCGIFNSRIAAQSCGIYSKSIIPSWQGVLRTLWIRDIYPRILSPDYINYFFFEKYTKMK